MYEPTDHERYVMEGVLCLIEKMPLLALSTALGMPAEIVTLPADIDLVRDIKSFMEAIMTGESHPLIDRLGHRPPPPPQTDASFRLEDHRDGKASLGMTVRLRCAS